MVSNEPKEKVFKNVVSLKYCLSVVVPCNTLKAGLQI